MNTSDINSQGTVFIVDISGYSNYSLLEGFHGCQLYDIGNLCYTYFSFTKNIENMNPERLFGSTLLPYGSNN